MDQDHCFICKVPLANKLKLESHFNCPKHEQAISICDNIDHDLEKCLFCISESESKELKGSNDSQLQASNESQPLNLPPPANRHCFLSFTGNDTQSNAFTVITFIADTQETDIFAVLPKEPEYQFWVWEYSGVAQLGPREFLVTGGYSEAEDGTVDISNECVIIRFEPIGQVYSYTVEDLPKTIGGRYTHKAFGTEGKQFLVAGGLDLKRNFLRSCEVFANGEWKQGPELNKARSQASGVNHGGFLYLFGGFSSPKVQEGSFERIDEKGLGKWELLQVKSESLALTGCLCVGYKNGVLIVGGSDGVKASKDILHWDVEKAEVLKRNEALAYDRVNAAGIFVDNQILVLGGEKDEEVKVELVGIAKQSKAETVIDPSEDQKIFHFNQPGFVWFYLK